MWISPAHAEEQREPTGSEFVLERVPAKSPQEALDSFEVAPGFRIELVAAEPLLVDPVAMAFDEHGRLYVVEMRDYSEQDKDRLGRVRLLSDEDGDGRFETSRVFADGLSWPTAVACYDGGVFIGNAPDILYCKDTDGDGVADERRVVFSGFGRSNVQGLLNSFQWGLDNRIHGATSSTGGKITRAGDVRGREPRAQHGATSSAGGKTIRADHVRGRETRAQHGDVRGRETRAQQRNRPSTNDPLDLRGRDFAFDPKTLEIVAETGGGQHGLSFNRWGDKFVCSNSDHLQAIVFEERYLARNPFQSVPSARRSIAADGPQAPVHRISPVESWRVARTKMRVAGLAPGPIEGGGQPAGYFTSATGVTAYEGGLWSHDDDGWVFVADVGSNLIHRKRLVPAGVTYRGERVDARAEFVRSSDIWFRPVQMAIGPEGALYVADMYREVIEHPASLPPELKRQLDLTSGRDRGRIYRIVPKDYRYSPPPSLASAGTAELVESLDHPNAWRRATASRLLYERQDPEAARLLRAKLAASTRPEGRIAMLYALRGHDALEAADVAAALNDPHPQVRRHALRLAEPILDTSADVREKIMSLAVDEERVVQFQLALTLGECHGPQASETLADVLVRNSEDADIVAAAMTSMSAHAGVVLKKLLASGTWQLQPHAGPILAALVQQIARQHRDDDLAVLITALTGHHDATLEGGRSTILKALAALPADALAANKSPLLAELQQLRHAATARFVADARLTLERDDASLVDRLAAIEVLALDTFANQQAMLEELLSPQEPAAIHAAVLAACAAYDDAEVAQFVLSGWSHFAPAERTLATELLLRREAWALALLRHLDAEGVTLTTLDPSHAARLAGFPSDAVRDLALQLRGRLVSEDRRQVFATYREAASSGGDSARGKLVFVKNCAACHQLEAKGEAIGPNLASMASRGAESLLFNVLVPNGEVDPRYLEYVILTVEGDVISGLIASETSTAITIRGADNKTTTVLRVDIEELNNTGKSLMPEGFEKAIDTRAMADLLAYLQEAAAEKGAER